MKIRATLRIRHDLIIAAREQLGMNQKDFADHCGVLCRRYQDLEKLQFKYVTEDDVAKIAAATGLTTDEIMPEAFAETNLNHTFVQRKYVDSDKLLQDYAQRHSDRLLVASPEEVAAIGLEYSEIAEHIKELPEREQLILKMRYGLDGAKVSGLEAVAKAFKVTRERIRMIEARIIKKLQQRVERTKRQRAFGTKAEMEALFE